MAKPLIYPIGTTIACEYASQFLNQAGFSLVDHPTPEVTHLLLDVPSFRPDGQLRGGGNVERTLEMLPHYIMVIGGNLEHPALEEYRKADLLQDENYLAANAAITADCALQVAAPMLSATFADSPVLIIGWGRIGKCLGKMLKAMGAVVTVAARKPTDLAMLRALGYNTADLQDLKTLQSYRLLFNTAPERVLSEKQLAFCKNCVKIDLASKKGLYCEDAVWARGLPGIHAPESSGKLIGKTIMHYLKEGI